MVFKMCIELDIDKIFPCSESIIKHDFKYVMIEHDNIKSQVYAIAEDPAKVPNCVLCLVKFLDGSPVIVRYDKSKLFKKILVPLF
jgi:hypothetical protein